LSERTPERPAFASPIPATLAAAGLVHVSDVVPGIRRVRHVGGFRYFDPGGRPLADRAALERIARLAIPPAYDDVWICAEPRGHLQATGRDARGRKQFRYHAAWRQLRDGEKFQRMPDFADALPRLRRRLQSDLALPGLPRNKVLAVVVRLLDTTHARIGNQEYVRQNGSFGLATLHSRHLHFAPGGSLELRFRGKGGVPHAVAIDDPRLARIVRRCHELPGQPLFQYVDDDGELRAIDSGQVNAYLRDAMGERFTAKDFRTWAATLRALALMHATPLPERATERALARAIAEAIRVVAAELRNTPAVCRKSYVNPLVFDAWRSGELHRGFRDVALVPRRAAAFLRRAARRAGRMPGAARSPERGAKKGRMPRHPPK
jgi:DNA topoisomerase IB